MALSSVKIIFVLTIKVSLYSKLLFGSEVVTLFWFRWIPCPQKCRFRCWVQSSILFRSSDMDKYVFSGSHFEKSKMAAMWIPVQMETLVFWLLMPSSFRKCIVFLIPKQIRWNWKFKRKRPDYSVLIGCSSVAHYADSVNNRQILRQNNSKIW